MKYYSGIYEDEKGKVLQVSNEVDGLSCEILADPGVSISKDFPTVGQMINSARITARFLMCHHLEINCGKGQGSYQYIKV